MGGGLCAAGELFADTTEQRRLRFGEDCVAGRYRSGRQMGCGRGGRRSGLRVLLLAQDMPVCAGLGVLWETASDFGQRGPVQRRGDARDGRQLRGERRYGRRQGLGRVRWRRRGRRAGGGAGRVGGVAPCVAWPKVAEHAGGRHDGCASVAGAGESLPLSEAMRPMAAPSSGQSRAMQQTMQ